MLSTARRGVLNVTGIYLGQFSLSKLSLLGVYLLKTSLFIFRLSKARIGVFNITSLYCRSI